MEASSPTERRSPALKWCMDSSAEGRGGGHRTLRTEAQWVGSGCLPTHEHVCHVQDFWNYYWVYENATRKCIVHCRSQISHCSRKALNMRKKWLAKTLQWLAWDLRGQYWLDVNKCWTKKMETCQESTCGQLNGVPVYRAEARVSKHWIISMQPRGICTHLL